MASIEIENASVRYFLRKSANMKKLARGNVGAQIIAGKYYLEIAALEGISLSLKDGDRVGLIGLNGSGKSTLLKLCAGALAVHTGSVKIEGKISPQFQLSSGIRPNLSGRRNAELKCLYMGLPQRAIGGYVEDVKAWSNLGGYFELPVETYSAGMRSRLLLSLLGLARGEILVMDEWISAGDPTVNRAVSKLQSDLIDKASILLIASHSPQILCEWADRLIWLDQGQIKAYGSFGDVYPEYDKWLTARAEEAGELADEAETAGRKKGGRRRKRPQAPEGW